MITMLKKVPTNHIVNSNFNCWQRGDIISLNDTDTTNGFKYFADMWNVYFERGVGNSYKFENVSNGVKCTVSKRVAINQFIPYELDSNTTYTLVAYVNNTIHKLTFTGQVTKESDDLRLKHMNVEDTSIYNRVIVYVDNNDIVNQVDLWEGTTVLMHSDQDYYLQLLRCQQLVFRAINSDLNVILDYYYTKSRTDTLVFNIMLPTQMISNPKLIIQYTNLYNLFTEEIIPGDDIEVWIMKTNNHYQYISIGVQKLDKSAFDSNGCYSLLVRNLLLTCEPSPN